MSDIMLDKSVFEETMINMRANYQYAQNYIFYNIILSNCNLILSNEVPVAGVSHIIDRFNLYINPEGFNPLSLENRLGILKHEALHIIHNHVMRKENKKMMPWNMGTDLAINQQITREHVEQGLHYDTFGYEKDLTAEQYYDLVTKDERFNQGENNEQNGSSNKSDKNNPSNSSNGGGKSSSNINSDNSNDGSNPSNLKGYDPHSTWDKSEGEIELVEHSIKKMLEKAIEHTQAVKGNIPIQAYELLNLYSTKKEIHWSKVLRNIVGNKKVSSRPTILKRNRRFPNRDDLRGTTRDRKFDVLTVLDVSGSMSDKEVIKMMSEIKNICDLTKTDLTMIQVDSEARAPEKIKKTVTSIIRKGYGGTDLRYAINVANEHKLYYDAIVVCTDGGICNDDIEAYKALNKRIIWLISKDGNEQNGMNSGKMSAHKFTYND